MQLDRLLDDATQMPPGTSQRQKHLKLADMLTDRHPAEGPVTLKRIEKWFERGSIPSAWLLRIAALPKKPLNLSNYA